MNHLVLLALATVCAGTICAQTPDASNAPPAKLESHVFNWDQLPVTPMPNGVRRAVFEGSTATVDKLHCHISTLNPGERSSEAHRHLQEEIIIVKEGTLEANYDGKAVTAGPGAVIFFASGATTFLRNPGTVPATYTVVYYLTPLTPKS